MDNSCRKLSNINIDSLQRVITKI